MAKQKVVDYAYYQDQLEMRDRMLIEYKQEILGFGTEQYKNYSYHYVFSCILDDIIVKAKVQYFIYSDTKEDFFNYLYNMFLAYKKAMAWDKTYYIEGKWDFFLYPLLLGNQEFINILQDFKWTLALEGDEGEQEAFIPRCYYTMYQSLLSQDSERYFQVKELLLKHKPVKLRQADYPYIHAMDELAGAKNKDVLKANIMELLKPRNHRTLSNDVDVMDTLGDLWSYYGMLLTKLCWLSGVEIEIEHKLVDMELITYPGNTDYKILYDFLK